MKGHEYTPEAIDYMLTNMTKLTQWEEYFIESITDQWHHKRTLTDRQKEVLGQIWEKQP